MKRVAFCRIIAIMKVTLQKIKVRHLPDIKNTDLDNKSAESVFFCCLKMRMKKSVKTKEMRKLRYVIAMKQKP